MLTVPNSSDYLVQVHEEARISPFFKKKKKLYKVYHGCGNPHHPLLVTYLSHITYLSHTIRFTTDLVYLMIDNIQVFFQKFFSSCAQSGVTRVRWKISRDQTAVNILLADRWPKRPMGTSTQDISL